jgi:endoglucanase
MLKRRRAIAAVVLSALGAGSWFAGASGAGSASGAPQARPAKGCSSRHSARRDPSNPLDLQQAPGSNPLNGARFFVEGPQKGLAAGAIAQMVGANPGNFATWPDLANDLDSAPLSRRLAADRGLAHRVNLMRKIAEQPETKWLTIYNRGGAPGAIATSTAEYRCRAHAADPAAIPVVMTYFLKHQGSCGTLRETPSDQTAFKRRVDELTSTVRNFPIVVFAEMDAINTADCLSPAGLSDRLALLKYEVDKLSKLPHGVIYVEGGVSDSIQANRAASYLNKVGIGKIRGFFLNETHYNWTSTEIAFGMKISKLTHGAHFVVDTRANGNGPLLNPDPVHQGTENLCNPAGRGLGPRPTVKTGSRVVDAFMWISTPGRSSGAQCHPGDAPAGIFDPGVALKLASKANSRVEPRERSNPY